MTSTKEYQSPVQLDLFAPAIDIPTPTPDSTPASYAEALGHAYLAFSRREENKANGHFLTPVSVAEFMASALDSEGNSHRVILDPGSGAGILSAAVCEAAYNNSVKSLHIHAYETDGRLAALTRASLNFSRDWLRDRDVLLAFNVEEKDFILEHTSVLMAASQGFWQDPAIGHPKPSYDLVISNPPYFKIGKDDPRALACNSLVYGQPNIYALFMAVSSQLLTPEGKLVYIVPRSFASGHYFKKFRKVFFRHVTPTGIHLFESRRDVFKEQAVLQESLIIQARRRSQSNTQRATPVMVSQSYGADDLDMRTQITVEMDTILDPESPNGELRIPVTIGDLRLIEEVSSWSETLLTLGLDISTGPVVPFRSREFLATSASEPDTVPLLWMQNVRPMRVEWPMKTARKAQWLRSTPMSRKLLVNDATYVLLRRFSAKEEKRRLVAAPVIHGSLNSKFVGLENHLNYIRGVSRELDDELANGIAVLLNSTLLDRYFRILNGNTQVSATELRTMPFPGEQEIRAIGLAVREGDPSSILAQLDSVIADTLGIPDYTNIAGDSNLR